MKTQIELIEEFTRNLLKVISFHGVNNDYFLHASALLRGANLGLSLESIYLYATAKMEEYKNESLNIRTHV